MWSSLEYNNCIFSQSLEFHTYYYCMGSISCQLHGKTRGGQFPVVNIRGL